MQPKSIGRALCPNSSYFRVKGAICFVGVGIATSPIARVRFCANVLCKVELHFLDELSAAETPFSSSLRARDDELFRALRARVLCMCFDPDRDWVSVSKIGRM